MSTFGLIAAIMLAIICLYLAQAKTTSNRNWYSLLGGIASLLVAFEAARRQQSGTAVLFACAALVSLMNLVKHYLTTKPDA